MSANERRRKAGNAIVGAVSRGAYDPGNPWDLVRAYMRILGCGDEHDLRATIVDLMTDVGHCAAAKGVSLDQIVGSVDSPGDDVHAQVFRSMKALLEHKGLSYEDALWSVGNHLGAELRPAASPSAR